MAGVRLRHLSFRDGVCLIQDGRPLQPYVCGWCKTMGRANFVHSLKTHHIVVDSEGYCIVSEKVWTRLQEVPDRAGFVEPTEVKNPPAIAVGSRYSIDGKRIHEQVAGAVLLEREGASL